MPAANIGTPDYQRGVVSPQILLATEPATTLTANIGVPPNVETLLIFAQEEAGWSFGHVKGTTTNKYYPFYQYVVNAPASSNPIIIASVEPAADGTYELQWITTGTKNWYVVGDSAVRQVVEANLSLVQQAIGTAIAGYGVVVLGKSTDNSGDLSVIDQNLKLAIAARAAAIPADAVQVGGSDGTNLRALRTNQSGVNYVIGGPPNTVTGDHPPQELTWNSFGINAAANILAAPGAGKRYRIHAITIASPTAGVLGQVYDASTNLILLSVIGTGNGTLVMPPPGAILSTNAALAATVALVAGTIYGSFYYTLETV